MKTKNLKESDNPLSLKVNTRTEFVISKAETHRDLLNKIEYDETVKDLKEGIKSFALGEGKPARIAFEELATKLNFNN